MPCSHYSLCVPYGHREDIKYFTRWDIDLNSMANSYSNSNGQMSKWVHCKVLKGLGWLVWLVRVLNLVPGVLLSFLCAHDQITKLISCLSFQFLNRNNASACHQEKTCRRPIQKNKIGVLLHLYLQWHVAD